MIGSLRLDDSTACMTVEGPADTEVFQAYVRGVLCPSLRPGDIVIMDNLSPHKNESTLALITQAGAQVLFLPAYSPDLNPIEKMWSKVKNFLRSAEARTEATLIAPIGAVLSSVTPRDAINWFAAGDHSRWKHRMGWPKNESPVAALTTLRLAIFATRKFFKLRERFSNFAR